MPPIWKSHLDSLQITSLADIFRTAKPVIGMVHCWPMPGAPGYQGYGMRDIIRHAQSDAEALIARRAGHRPAVDHPDDGFGGAKNVGQRSDLQAVEV